MLFEADVSRLFLQNYIMADENTGTSAINNNQSIHNLLVNFTEEKHDRSTMIIMRPNYVHISTRYFHLRLLLAIADLVFVLVVSTHNVQ